VVEKPGKNVPTPPEDLEVERKEMERKREGDVRESLPIKDRGGKGVRTRAKQNKPETGRRNDTVGGGGRGSEKAKEKTTAKNGGENADRRKVRRLSPRHADDRKRPNS